MDVVKVTGTIVELFNEVQISEKFKKRELVVQTDETYPQEIIIQFTQDQCSILDNFGEGQVVEVSYNLRGRSWESPSGEKKWFNTIQGWRIDSIEGNIKPPSGDSAKAEFELDEDTPF